MVPTIIDSICIPLMIIIFIQDLKYRAIHIIAPILLFLLGLVQFVHMDIAITQLLVTAAFLGITLLGAYGYFSIKYRKISNPFKSLIGLGDVLYFVAVIPFFITANYMLFLVLGLLFSMVSFFVVQYFQQTKLIPLAGLLSLFFILLKVSAYIFEIDLFYKRIF